MVRTSIIAAALLCTTAVYDSARIVPAAPLNPLNPIEPVVVAPSISILVEEITTHE